MFPIEQSPFLHALGYAIGHSLWQMSLLWLVYTAVIHLHQWTSSQRYNLAVSAATTGFAWFLITLFYYSNHINLSQDTLAMSNVPASEKFFTPAGKFIFIYHSAMATLRSLAPYFSCAYLVVMLLLSIRLANGFNEVKQLRTIGLSKASVDWRLFVKEHAAILGIKKPVLLFISSIAASPLTIGFWKPFILIPLASINQLSPQQLEAVLLHELAHIRRNDYLLNIILQLAEISLFFNPFMRLLLKQARLERENSCDDYVLQFQYNAADYAKALLTIEQHSVESILALGSNSQNEFQLLNRIKRMLAPERQAFNYRQQLGLLFLITLLGLGFTVISPKQQSQTIVEMKKPVAGNKSKDVSVFEKMIPAGVDLIKNLENIQQFKRITSSPDFKDKTKKIENAFSKAGNNLDAQIKPHIKQIEATELQIEDLLKHQNINGQNAIQLNEWQLKELGNADWAKIFTPALEESLKVLALPRIVGEDNWKIAETPETRPVVPDKLKAEIAGVSPLSREQLRQVSRLQAKINKEQKHLLQMTEMQHMIADSMQFTFGAPNTQPLAYYNEAFARARKQAAIAPFRQREKDNPGYYKPAEPNHNFYTYSYNNGNDNDDEDDASQVYMQTDDEVDSDRKMKHKADCTSPEPKKPGTKRVTVFNGKEFSAKVKQVWAEAQQQMMQQEWTEEMQQKVAKDIERELKQFDHVEIKTHITTRPDSNKKTILIEVETTSGDN